MIDSLNLKINIVFNDVTVVQTEAIILSFFFLIAHISLVLLMTAKTTRTTMIVNSHICIGCLNSLHSKSYFLCFNLNSFLIICLKK